MHISRPPHNWQISPQQAIVVQRHLASLYKESSTEKPFRFVAGLDAAYSKSGEFCIAGVVLWCLETRRVVETHTARTKLRFPYIPGLLTFREGPAILAVLRKLQKIPDVLICDGQGIAHPRRCGIATHIGILCDLPAVGCAKSRLVGDFREPGPERGSRSPLTDKGAVIGSVLRTRERVKPLFISIGHRIDLAAAEKLILACGAGYRLPEPTRLADHLVAAAKRNRS